ncbi:spindle pole body component 110-like [Aphis craccivora]|uniref:Spindle pole body component 110-like n=1 Tax=Aphis craccivora TaxID=307492 RepID=A0A6G0VHT6_APHCR|nr:spindle pole body component 110-like [Aphis craccivora]
MDFQNDEDDYDLGKIEVLTTNNASKESSLNFYGESFDEIKKKMDTVVNIVNGMENRVMETELRCSKLEKDVDYLKIILNNKEQASLNQSVEITGIPKTPNEDIPNIITSVANILNISIKNEDIVDTYRLKPYKNTDGKIIAKFNSTILKDSIIKSIKFPHSFKNTIIIPLHKQLNKSDCSNYRPIALTITLSKVLEKCIKEYLKYLDTNLKWQNHIINTTRKLRLLFNKCKTISNIL